MNPKHSPECSSPTRVSFLREKRFLDYVLRGRIVAATGARDEGALSKGGEARKRRRREVAEARSGRMEGRRLDLGKWRGKGQICAWPKRRPWMTEGEVEKRWMREARGRKQATFEKGSRRVRRSSRSMSANHDRVRVRSRSPAFNALAATFKNPTARNLSTPPPVVRKLYPKFVTPDSTILAPKSATISSSFEIIERPSPSPALNNAPSHSEPRHKVVDFLPRLYMPRVEVASEMMEVRSFVVVVMEARLGISGWRDLIENACPLATILELNLDIDHLDKDFVDSISTKSALNLVSTSTVPINSCGGTELDDLDSFRDVYIWALTATPEKLHRVCDNCYVKLKVFDENGSSKLDKKPTTTTTTTTNNFINEKEKSNQAAIRPSRILLAPITEPVKYLEIKNNNPEDNGDSTSFVRASLVPSLTQLKDVAFPTSLSSIQTILKPIIPLSPPQTPTQTPPQTPTPNTSPGPKFTNTVRQSAARPASPRFYGSINDSLRRTNDILNQEVAKLQKQIQSLKDKSDMQDLEIKRLNKKATEASALAAVEYSNHRVTKEFVESTISQMKEVTDKLPGEISESRHLKDVLIRVKNFLKETSESETSSSPNLKTKPKVAPEIPTSNNDSSKFHAEDKVAATEAKPCQDELEQSKKSNLKHEQQNVDHDKQNLHEETDKSKLESTQQNIPSSDSITSEMHEHKLDEIVHVIEVIHCENRGNSIKESDGSKQEIENQKDRTLSSSSDISELLDDHRLDNAEVAGVDESQEQDHVFHECIGAQMNLENSEDGSRSSPPGNQGEVQVIEKFAHGVYVILMLQPDGLPHLLRDATVALPSWLHLPHLAEVGKRFYNVDGLMQVSLDLYTMGCRPVHMLCLALLSLPLNEHIQA
ncbi:Villin-4 protein [Vigna angularis]|uniref:Villin-4 protein n=1 Tax=Phaseolus angularis TaxID=3914 RepID=A0A8T0JTS4_PHAAN|nr:Villin-4 protein [Vigna angularis]